MYTEQDLIDFETDIADCFNNGMIKAPIHLYYGNEKQIIEVFKNVKKDDAYQMLAYAVSKRKDGKASYPLVGLLYPSLQAASAEVLSFTNLDSPIHLAWVPVTKSGLDAFNLDAILGRVLFTENKLESTSVVALSN